MAGPVDYVCTVYAINEIRLCVSLAVLGHLRALPFGLRELQQYGGEQRVMEERGPKG